MARALTDQAEHRTLSEEAWAQICAAAKRHDPPLTVGPEARAVISACLFDEYPALAHDRRSNEAMYRWASKALRHCEALVELYDDEAAPRGTVRADADLWGLKLLYQTAGARFSASRAFRRANAGRRNPQRAWLVSRLCAIWIWDFGGHLSVTTPPLGGPPRGALIDFLLAAMSQVIPGHDLPSPDTLRDQIKRERKDRENARQLGLFLDRFFKQRQ